MKFLVENLNPYRWEESKDFDWYVDNRIPSKFDKWLGYDVGPIRWDPGMNKEDIPDFYDGMYEEAWNFVGRQPNGRYYFLCVNAPYYHRDLEGKVISFKSFRDATYQVAFPGRGY